MRQSTLTLRWFGAEAADGGAENGSAETDRADAPEEQGPAEAEPAETTEETGRAAEDAAARETRRGESFESVMRKAALAARLQAAEATAARWEREAQALREIYPSFSLEDAMRSDGDFVPLLRAGLPVRTAFEAANLETILGAAMRYAAGAAGKRLAQSLRAGAGRVRENPVLDRASSVRKKDVGSLTEREIMKIIRQVGNGERVTF